jgi:hypothetical protein
VGSRVFRRPSLSGALLVAALASCVYELPPPVTLPAPTAASAEELRWAVEGALAVHKWTVLERAPGSITAFVFSRNSGDKATIEIRYQPGAIVIRCTERQVSSARYDRWIQLLSSEIQKNAALVGMRPSRPPPPSAAP